MLFSVSAKRLCGRLEAEQNGLAGSGAEDQDRMYQAEWRKPCCNKPNLVGSQVTTANGDFDFEQFLGGEYRLAVKSDGRENLIGIDLGLRYDWKGGCEIQAVVVEKDFLTWFAGRSIM